MVIRKCKRCGIKRDSDIMYYSKSIKGFICNPTNYVHRAECSARLNGEDSYSSENTSEVKG